MRSGSVGFVSAGHKSCTSDMMIGGLAQGVVLLHPQNAAEVFVNVLGSLALAATNEKAVGRMERVGSKHKLILLTSAKRARFPVKFSAHGSDSSNLFVHKTSGERESNFGDPTDGSRQAV